MARIRAERRHETLHDTYQDKSDGSNRQYENGPSLQKKTLENYLSQPEGRAG
jgi:hypothetical protein